MVCQRCITSLSAVICRGRASYNPPAAGRRHLHGRSGLRSANVRPPRHARKLLPSRSSAQRCEHVTYRQKPRGQGGALGRTCSLLRNGSTCCVRGCAQCLATRGSPTVATCCPQRSAPGALHPTDRKFNGVRGDRCWGSATIRECYYSTSTINMLYLLARCTESCAPAKAA